MTLSGQYGCWHLHYMCLGMVGNLLNQEEDHFPPTCQVKMLPFELRGAVAALIVYRTCILDCWFCLLFFFFNSGDVFVQKLAYSFTHYL